MPVVRRNRFSGLDKQYEIHVTDYSHINRQEVGRKFNYHFFIQNNGPLLPFGVAVVDCDTKEATPIPSLPSGHGQVVVLGPYTCPEASMLEKNFFVCYRDEEGGWVRIGHKFGLRVRGYKNEARIFGSSIKRNLLRDLKFRSGSTKAEEYLEMKLSSMGIDLERVELDRETLVDMVRQIQ